MLNLKVSFSMTKISVAMRVEFGSAVYFCESNTRSEMKNLIPQTPKFDTDAQHIQKSQLSLENSCQK